MSAPPVAYPVCRDCGHIHRRTISLRFACENCGHVGTLTFKRSPALAFETSELIRRRMLAS